MTKRARWELSVTITKDLKSLKWLASDGDDIEVGKTPTEALEGLWELRKDYVNREYEI